MTTAVHDVLREELPAEAMEVLERRWLVDDSLIGHRSTCADSSKAIVGAMNGFDLLERTRTAHDACSGADGQRLGRVRDAFAVLQI